MELRKASSSVLYDNPSKTLCRNKLQLCFSRTLKIYWDLNPTEGKDHLYVILHRVPEGGKGVKQVPVLLQTVRPTPDLVLGRLVC